MYLLKILLIINFFEFRPHFGKRSIIFVPYELSYHHFGSYGVTTNNNIWLFYNRPSYDIGVSLSILFDEGVDSRNIYAEKLAYGGTGLNLFFQKKFIKSYDLFFPFNVRIPFEGLNSQLRTIKPFRPSFKFSPSYYIFLGENFKPGIKAEGIYNISGERSLYEINPSLEVVLFPEKIASLSFLFKYKNIFSSENNFSYPEIRASLFSNPFPNLFMLLSGFISLKSPDNPFQGALRGDYLYGEPVIKERAGFRFVLGLVFYPVEKRKIEIYVRDEEGNPLSPSVEENPAMGLKKKKEGIYEKIDASPDTYLIQFSLPEFNDTFIYIYPEDVEKEYSKFFVVMKKVKQPEIVEEPETTEVVETPEEEEMVKQEEEQIPERIDFYFYFDSTKAEIREVYRDTFNLIVERVENIEKDTINIIAKGDASPEGDTLFNRKLSLKRAENIAEYLKGILPENKFFIFKIESEYNSGIKPSDIPKREWWSKRRVHLKIKK